MSEAEETMVMVDHPRAILCTCGHPLGLHDLTHACFPCTCCKCDVYLTDWDVAHELGFTPPPSRKAYVPRDTARTRWKVYRRGA